MGSEQFCVEQNTEIEDVNLTDYMYLIIASIISSCGFVLDSETIVIGSMLISPLLKPVLNFVDAITTWNVGQKIIRTNLGHTLMMILLVIFIGWIFGATLKYIDYDLYKKHKKALNVKNNDLTSKNMGTGISTIIGRRALMYAPGPIYFYVGIVAFLGGILLARSKCKDNTISTIIIGTGISTSVLPPIIASGMWTGIGGFEIIPKYQTPSVISGIGLGLGNIFLIFLGYLIGTHYHKLFNSKYGIF